MRNKRTLFWRTALRDLRGPRPEPAAGDVREARLRATAGVEAGLALTSWRGRSGRRYVAAVQALPEAEVADWDGAVVLAVVREPDGAARLVATACGDAPEARRRAWLAGAARRGASEIHVHRLAETPAARLAARADLATPGERARPDRSRRLRPRGGCEADPAPRAARPARAPSRSG
ncbi:hypothetical protein [Salinarimonas sp.]|uniref:hypothetical protein n=1 Tax=Salinarimonas sp. TaxID=2766526 RepID=UPI0032D9AB96